MIVGAPLSVGNKVSALSRRNTMIELNLVRYYFKYSFILYFTAFTDTANLSRDN